MRAERKFSMWWLFLLAFACSPGLLAGEPALSPVDVHLKAKITIEPEGGISRLTWMEQDEGKLALARTIEPTVRALEFEPGAINGVPAVTETALSMMLRATPTPEGDWRIAIRSASTGAMAEKMDAPQYPSTAARVGVEAEVLSVIEVDASGRATVVDAAFESSAGETAFRKAFLGASEKAIAGWRFVPERVGGHPVAGRMRVPISYCLGGGPWCKARNLQRLADLGPGADEPVPLESVARLKSVLPGADI